MVNAHDEVGEKSKDGGFLIDSHIVPVLVSKEKRLGIEIGLAAASGDNKRNGHPIS